MAEKVPEGEKAGGPQPADDPLRRALDHVRQALQGLQFGEVTLTVQDGIVIQIERVERKRLDRPARRR